MYRRLGVPFEILDSAEMRRRRPDLDPPEGFVGLHDPLGGYSEPDEYIRALARCARELGVEVRELEKVAGFMLDGGRVAGVQTASGEEGADAVVASVYAWTERVLEPLGLRLPVKAFVYQRYVSRPLSPRPPLPAVNANPLDGYVRPATGDRLLAGIETAARAQFDFVPPRAQGAL